MNPMYKDKRSIFIMGLAFLVAAMVHWTVPIEELEMLNKVFILKWSVGAFIVGVIGVIMLKQNPMQTGLLAVIGFVAAVLVRLVVDAFTEPTDHNLWPFELIVAVLVAFPFSFIGGYLASIALRPK